MRYTIKQLERIGQQNGDSWYDILYYWMECGYEDMMDIFNHMSKKETLQVIAYIIDNGYMSDRVSANLYKCAMTSLEGRL